jgi:hypothetical protein
MWYDKSEMPEIVRVLISVEVNPMALATAEEIYEQVVKPLPATERLRLVEKVVHDLWVQPPERESLQRHDWMSIRGVAPNLLGGEDAQEWVSRTRREADEHREKQWRREP